MTDLLDTDFVPHSEDDRKRIRDAVQEASGLKQIQKDKADQIKDIVDFIYSEWAIPKKLVRQLITTFHKQNYPETTTEAAMFEVLYENVIGSDNT